MIEPVGHLLPHSGRMMLISRILDYHPGGITTEAEIRADHIFNENGVLPNWAFVEIMAQSIAALSGLLSQSKGEAPRLGFLLGSRSICLYAPSVAVPACLRSEIVESTRDEVLGLGVYRAQLFHAGTLLAEGALNVYQPPQDEMGEIFK